MYNSGRKYEELVREIQASLFEAEKIPFLKNINIEINKKLQDRSGIEREFDIYWEFEIGGSLYRSVIECKDYSSPISIEKIDAFIGKTNDIPGLKLIYATRTGYQSGAKIKAEKHNIQLLIIRDQQESDWITDDGEYLLKTIHLNIVARSLPRVNNYHVQVDVDWFQNQKKYTQEDLQNLFSFKLNNQLLIKDIENHDTFSFYDLPERILKKRKNLEYGSGSYSETYSNAWIEDVDKLAQIKITGFNCDYIYNEPIKTTSVIDFSEQIKAIVEDLMTGKKKWVMNDGTVK